MSATSSPRGSVDTTRGTPEKISSTTASAETDWPPLTGAGVSTRTTWLPVTSTGWSTGRLSLQPAAQVAAHSGPQVDPLGSSGSARQSRASVSTGTQRTAPGSSGPTSNRNAPICTVESWANPLPSTSSSTGAAAGISTLDGSMRASSGRGRSTKSPSSISACATGAQLQAASQNRQQMRFGPRGGGKATVRSASKGSKPCAPQAGRSAHGGSATASSAPQAAPSGRVSRTTTGTSRLLAGSPLFTSTVPVRGGWTSSRVSANRMGEVAAVSAPPPSTAA